MRLRFATLLAVLFPSIAAAQNGGIYIQGGPLLDRLLTSSSDGIPVDVSIGSSLTYQWNDINGDRRWQPGEEGPPVLNAFPSFETRTSSQSRFAPGASLAVGAFVAPSVSLRVEGSFQGKHVTTSETTLRTLLAPGMSRHATAITDVLVAAGWHQGQSRRASVTYLGGMVFRHTREETTLTSSYRVLQIIDGRVAPSPATHTVEETFGSTAYSAGVMAGVDVAFILSQRVAIVPQFRAVVANDRLSFRPAVTMRWRP